MGSLLAIKVGRDLWLARGRALTMIVAIGVSIVALGTVLGAYSVLSREMAPSFEDGLRCQEILDAAIRSDAEGRWVEI